MPTLLSSVSFREIPNWENDDHLAAFESFLPSAKRMVETPYKTRGLGVDGLALAHVSKAAVELSKKKVTASIARSFFETAFEPNGFKNETGFLTGYFEPVVSASKVCSSEYPEPLFMRPPDLLDVTDGNRPIEMDASFRYGRKTELGIEEYYNRQEISTGALSGQGLELVYLKSKTDAFFIHVQGSAKLELEDGSLMRVTYAAKSGHPYSSIAKVLCSQLNIPPAEMTADRLKDWMNANSEELDELLFHNQSFIFFEEVVGTEPSDGPIAAAKTPLISGRSMAVDRTLHTFGSPIWLMTKKPLPDDTEPLSRLMVAQDTGSAIVGPCRGDIFVGSGDAAGFIAGRVRHESEMIVFVPKPNFKLSDMRVL